VSPEAQKKTRAKAQEFEAMFLNSMFSQMTSGIRATARSAIRPAPVIWRSHATDEILKILRQIRRRRHIQRRLPHLDPAASQPRRLTEGETDMNQRPQARPAAAPAQAISTPDEARKLAEDLTDVMGALLGVIEREPNWFAPARCARRWRWNSRRVSCHAPLHGDDRKSEDLAEIPVAGIGLSC